MFVLDEGTSAKCIRKKNNEIGSVQNIATLPGFLGRKKCVAKEDSTWGKPCGAWDLEEEGLRPCAKVCTRRLVSWVGYENPPWRSSLHAILFKAFLNSAPQLAADVVLPSWPGAGR